MFRRQGLFRFVLVLIAACVLAGVFLCAGHHHEDGASHGDCPVCLQMAAGQAGIAISACFRIGTIPRFVPVLACPVSFVRPNPLLARNYPNAPPV